MYYCDVHFKQVTLKPCDPEENRFISRPQIAVWWCVHVCRAKQQIFTKPYLNINIYNTPWHLLFCSNSFSQKMLVTIHWFMMHARFMTRASAFLSLLGLILGAVSWASRAWIIFVLFVLIIIRAYCMIRKKPRSPVWSERSCLKSWLSPDLLWDGNGRP